MQPVAPPTLKYQVLEEMENYKGIEEFESRDLHPR